jgi:hypothetical protein
VIAYGYHQEQLTKMIKAICVERQIVQNGKTQYSWRLPIFDTIQWSDSHALATASQTRTQDLCLYSNEIVNRQWEKSMLDLSSSHAFWTIAQIPFQEPEARRLLEGLWLNDNIIDAYLVLCGYLRPDIKFLSTQWFCCLEIWRNDASSKSISWVRGFHILLAV